MGARPSSFRKGGGFLNNVDAVWSDYEFTTEFPGSDGKRSSKSDFNPLYAVLTFDVDGAEKSQETTLLVGSADDFDISKDGKSLEPVDGAGLRASMPFSFYIESLIEAGFDETELPDDDEPINYEAALGRRYRLVQVPDDEAMKKMAKKWRQSQGKYNEQGQKKGKDGKFYNLTRLKVEQVYDGEAVEKVAPAKGAKGAKPAKGAKGGPSVEQEAVEALLAILADNDGSIPKASIPNKVTQKIGMKHPKRDEIRKLVYSDEFLETEQGWTYDKSSKKQTITLAEEDEE